MICMHLADAAGYLMTVLVHGAVAWTVLLPAGSGSGGNLWFSLLQDEAKKVWETAV